MLLLPAHLPGWIRNKFVHSSLANMMYDVVEVSKDVAEVLCLVVDLLSFYSARFGCDFFLNSACVSSISCRSLFVSHTVP